MLSVASGRPMKRAASGIQKPSIGLMTRYRTVATTETDVSRAAWWASIESTESPRRMARALERTHPNPAGVAGAAGCGAPRATKGRWVAQPIAAAPRPAASIQAPTSADCSVETWNDAA